MEKLTAKQKTEITYNMLQKQKIRKAGEKENMVYEITSGAVKRCMKGIE